MSIRILEEESGQVSEQEREEKERERERLLVAEQDETEQRREDDEGAQVACAVAANRNSVIPHKASATRLADGEKEGREQEVGRHAGCILEELL